MRICFQSARLKTGQRRRGWGITLLAALGSGVLALAASPAPDPGEVRPVVTAGFTLPEVKQPIPGAQEAVIAAAWKSADGTRLIGRAQWEALGSDWSKLMERAEATWTEVEKLQPELVRDKRGVLECAIFRALEPGGDLTGAILAPGFLKHFTPLFGPKLLVAMPDRCTLFVFPRLATRYTDYAERVLKVYQAAQTPVSREIYEVSAGGVRAIGVYEAP